MNNLEITEINILPLRPRNGLLGFASCVINKQFFIGDIAIYSAPTNKYGFRLVFPVKKLANGQRVNCFHPISSEAGEAVTKAIIDKYQELMNNFNHIE